MVSNSRHWIFCKKLWRRVIPFYFLPLILGVILFLLFFGKPHWHKSIYIFQFKFRPEIKPEIPASFNGLWTDYIKTDTSDHEYTCDMKNGKPWDGQYVSIGYIKPRGFVIENYKNGSRINGTTDFIWATPHQETFNLEVFSRKGKKLFQFFFKKGKKHGEWLEWNSRGELVSTRWFLFGKEVSKKAFENWAIQEFEKMLKLPD